MDATTLKTTVFELCGGNNHTITISTGTWNAILSMCTRLYAEKHFSGSQRSVYALDLVAGQTEYTLPDNVISVVSILDFGDSNTMGGYPSIRKQLYDRDGGRQELDMISYSYFTATLSAQKISFGTYYQFEWSPATKEFALLNASDSGTTTIYLEIFKDMTEDETAMALIREDWIFQQMLVAQLMIKWSYSMIKYSGSQLIGGRVLAYDEIRDAGKDLWEETMELISTQYEEPVELIFG